METEKPNEANPVVKDRIDASETCPSRVAHMIPRSKVSNGIGVADLLGDL